MICILGVFLRSRPYPEGCMIANPDDGEGGFTPCSCDNILKGIVG